MYIPKQFKITDQAEIKAFIQKHSFGTLVTTIEGKPVASHLPLELQDEGDDWYITGHMAKGNQQWKAFNHNEVLVIFQGPHAYISSSCYESENVPTWNYQSIHVYGTVSMMNKQELQEDLTRLLQKYEHHREQAVLWENLTENTKKQINGIVGFKIKVLEIQAAYKLSQNRHAKDYSNIIEMLNKEGTANSQEMAEVMQNRM